MVWNGVIFSQNLWITDFSLKSILMMFYTIDIIFFSFLLKFFRYKIILLTYSRETGFSFSYGKVGDLHQAYGPSNEIDRVSKFDNSLSFGAKQNALRQIFFALWFFKDLINKNFDWIFFDFLWFCVGSIKKCLCVCLSMQIQENMFVSTAAPLWGRFWAI